MPLTSHCCAIAYHQQWQWLGWVIISMEMGLNAPHISLLRYCISSTMAVARMGDHEYGDGA
jgi:hypothetical protein